MIRHPGAGPVAGAPALPAATAFVFTLLFGASAAFAGSDRVPPTAPTDLRVTATTAFSASLPGNPSSDNPGSFSCVVHAGNGQDLLPGRTSTSFTFTAGLEAGRSYSFYVYAVDGAANES